MAAASRRSPWSLGRQSKTEDRVTARLAPKLCYMKRIPLILAFIIMSYVSMYMIFTIRGAYMPGAMGTNGIKWWGWVPAQFTDATGRYRPALFIIYFPLLYLDKQYWHKKVHPGPGDRMYNPYTKPRPSTAAKIYSAQQGDAPEPATNANPASRTPLTPAR